MDAELNRFAITPAVYAQIHALPDEVKFAIVDTSHSLSSVSGFRDVAETALGMQFVADVQKMRQPSGLFI